MTEEKAPLPPQGEGMPEPQPDDLADSLPVDKKGEEHDPDPAKATSTRIPIVKPS